MSRLLHWFFAAEAATGAMSGRSDGAASGSGVLKAGARFLGTSAGLALASGALFAGASLHGASAGAATGTGILRTPGTTSTAFQPARAPVSAKARIETDPVDLRATVRSLVSGWTLSWEPGQGILVRDTRGRLVSMISMASEKPLFQAGYQATYKTIQSLVYLGAHVDPTLAYALYSDSALPSFLAGDLHIKVPYTWPGASAGGTLTNDGSGNLSWSAASSALHGESAGLATCLAVLKAGGKLSGTSAGSATATAAPPVPGLVYDASKWGSIQAAVNAASVNGGGIVWLREGTWSFSSQIDVPRKVSLLGAGIETTKLSYGGSGIALRLTTTGAAVSSRHYGVVGGFQLENDGTGTHGIRIQDAGHLHLKDLVVLDFATAGVHLYTTGSEINISNLFESMECTGNGIGVLVSGVNSASNHLTFSHCKLRMNKCYNYRTDAAAESVTFIGTDLEGMTGHYSGCGHTDDEAAIHSQYCGGLTIIGCYYEPGSNDSSFHFAILGNYDNDSVAGGIHASGVVIKGCQILGYSGHTAIILGNSSSTYPSGPNGFDISGNHFGTFSTGIDLQDGYNGTLGPNHYESVTTPVSLGSKAVNCKVHTDSDEVLFKDGTESATSTTDGLAFVPTVNGAPSGTPASRTGSAALVFDRSNSRLYIYWPGVGWKYVSVAT